MAKEIERKFLVDGGGWRTGAVGVRIRQGYLVTSPEFVVRIRTLGDQAYLTIKGAKQGLSRSEYEYPIALADADEMLNQLCQKPLIEKVRYAVRWQAHEWVVDVFEGDNAGLVVAEVELAAEDEAVALPPWVGAEVTDDARYLNANLVAQPFSRWGEGRTAQ